MACLRFEAKVRDGVVSKDLDGRGHGADFVLASSFGQYDTGIARGKSAHDIRHCHDWLAEAAGQNDTHHNRNNTGEYPADNKGGDSGVEGVLELGVSGLGRLKFTLVQRGQNLTNLGQSCRLGDCRPGPFKFRRILRVGNGRRDLAVECCYGRAKWRNRQGGPLWRKQSFKPLDEGRHRICIFGHPAVEFVVEAGDVSAHCVLMLHEGRKDFSRRLQNVLRLAIFRVRRPDLLKRVHGNGTEYGNDHENE